MQKKDIEKLEPKVVWRHFSGLSRIPRGSGKEERIVAFVSGFGLALDLETTVDATGNVVIRKPATEGMEKHPTVALQCHLDMVQQKEDDLEFNFDEDAIRLIVEEDWIRADRTTLGADNGIGVALIMAVLASTDIAHPPLEALFTVDEEVGMSGAEAISPDQLNADYLVNLDMESDHELTIGCAGSIEILAETKFNQQPLQSSHHLYEIEVRGGAGGHSGLDIHLDKMNGIKLLAKALAMLNRKTPIVLTRFICNGTSNVIPGKAVARFAVAAENQKVLQKAINENLGTLCNEYIKKEPRIQIRCHPVQPTAECGFDTEFQAKFLQTIEQVPNGVHAMSPEVEGLVETSNNLAITTAVKGEMNIVCMARTCKEEGKKEIIALAEESFSLIGAQTLTEADQPGWEPRTKGILIDTMSKAYADLHGAQPGIIAIHAGVECGILSSTFPEMEMVSYGPNIEGAHTTGERVQISSVQKVWRVLQQTLADIPAK